MKGKLYAIKKDMKNANIHVLCSFSCKSFGITYDNKDGYPIMKDCTRIGKSLLYWPYAFAPGWCPRLKLNGGNE